MRPLSIIIAASIGALAAGPAYAATNAPLTFDCDAPAGRSSSVTVTGGSAVRAAMRIVPVALRSGRLQPNAGLSIASADGKNSVGIQIAFASADAKVFSLAVVGQTDGAAFRTPLAELPIAAPIEAIIQIDANGQGLIRIGAQQAPLAVADLGPKTVSAFCGAGQFRFAPLSVVSN